MASLLIQTLLPAVALYAIWILCRHFVVRSCVDHIRGPKDTSPLLGGFPGFMTRNAWAFLDDIAEGYGGITKLRDIFGERMLYVTDPVALHAIMVKNQHLYEEPSEFLVASRLLLGPGLLSSFGDIHRKQRKILNAVFSPANIRNIAPALASVADRFRSALVSEVRDGPKELDVSKWTARAVLEMNGQGIMNYSFDPLTVEKPNEYALAVKESFPSLYTIPVHLYIAIKWTKIFGVTSFGRWFMNNYPHPRVQKSKSKWDLIWNQAKYLVTDKKSAKDTGHADKDLLSVLVEVNASAGDEDRLSDKELIAQVNHVLYAGVETTQTAIARFLHTLALHPEVQNQLRREIVDALGDDDELPYDRLTALPFLHAVYRETLRLHAPVLTLNRVTLASTVLPLSRPISDNKGHMIREVALDKGTTVMLGIHGYNRSTAFWGEDATEFKPERWLSPLPESIREVQCGGIFANTMTFIGGPRGCMLTLSAFDDVFHLHLRPNENLIHPAARINHYRIGADGNSVLSHTEPLLPESVRAYWGEVVYPDVSADRLREDAAGVSPRPSGKSELGWARITVHCQGDVTKAPVFEGAFSVDGNVHHVMSKEHYLNNKHEMDPHAHLIEAGDDAEIVIWRDSDVMTPHEYHAASGGMDDGPIPLQPAKTCGHDNLRFNTDPLENQALRRPLGPPATSWYDPLGILDSHISNSSLAPRDDVAGGDVSTNFVDDIGNTAGCPSTQKVIYMGVAADCAYVTQYGSPANASQHIISNLNTASALYKTTFNVSLGIVELAVQDSQCPTTADPAIPWNVGCDNTTLTLNDRLSLFSEWRGQKGNDGAGLWHFDEWLSNGGTPGNIVSGTAVSTAGRVEWQVVSHEIGHNFGAIHDCTDGCETNGIQCCPLTASTCDANSQFIMNPVAQSSEMKFSQCSLGNICSLMTGNSGGHTNTTCLVDAASARQTISLQMCGNGIVEDGEDCDPGAGTTSSCCNSTTCKFTSGAVCDPASSPCCTQQCGFAPTTQVCRPSKDATCDTAEVCTGNSSSCPTDIFSPNGQSCGSNGLACANGVCTSLDKQCQTVGASMNLTKACPSPNNKSCQVSCQDPTTANQCVVLQSALIDGSPCGYGGTCSNGSCQAGSLLDTVKSWYTQNLQISIPITVAVGIIVLLIIYFSVRACCRCSTRNNKQNQKMKRLSSWGNPPPGMVQVAPGAYPQRGLNPK
ncbi:hypothetical protein EUX98_g3806 [Antrodiella citrinella]|uniref:Disintegrin and metalloproteinase domain-containing protein B n=1 Tax=Antrodiella citrinella TaxID=2447956 RepID=A0A4S4N3Q9_9APHY|nr:hypothetical protein EUX98_g3806 [Antrodiella citrinella]